MTRTRLALAQEIQEKIKSGASFAEMASIYSQGSQKKVMAATWAGSNVPCCAKNSPTPHSRSNPAKPATSSNTPDAYYLLLVEEKRPAHVRADQRSFATTSKKTLRARQQRHSPEKMDRVAEAKNIHPHFRMTGWVGISLGDVTGISPEVALKAVAAESKMMTRSICSSAMKIYFRALNKKLSLNLPLKKIFRLQERWKIFRRKSGYGKIAGQSASRFTSSRECLGFVLARRNAPLFAARIGRARDRAGE